MYKIKIQNPSREIVLSFATKREREDMIEAINNCIKRPVLYPTLNYQDLTDHVIFTAEFLKISLIVMPNV